MVHLVEWTRLQVYVVQVVASVQVFSFFNRHYDASKELFQELGKFSKSGGRARARVAACSSPSHFCCCFGFKGRKSKTEFLFVSCPSVFFRFFRCCWSPQGPHSPASELLGAAGSLLSLSNPFPLSQNKISQRLSKRLKWNNINTLLLLQHVRLSPESVIIAAAASNLFYLSIVAGLWLCVVDKDWVPRWQNRPLSSKQWTPPDRRRSLKRATPFSGTDPERRRRSPEESRLAADRPTPQGNTCSPAYKLVR